jgi:hypothetical protein
MKVIIQIPCHDEEATLAATVRELPRSLTGVDELELLVIAARALAERAVVEDAGRGQRRCAFGVAT